LKEVVLIKKNKMKKAIITITAIIYLANGIAQEKEYDYFLDEVMANIKTTKIFDAQDDGTPLIKAVRLGDLDAVKALVEKGADINKGVKFDSSPLIEASRLGYLSIVKYLINNKADVNNHITGDETPLIRAAWNGHLDIVKYLVQNGADINLTVREDYKLGSEKRNALRMAKVGNHKDVVSYLIKKGAK
jgi:ankyrin repeat protein